MTTTDEPDRDELESGGPDRDERHRERMARKKEVVDRKIAQAQAERGVVLVATGPGKGKSSSGFGMVIRALGHGLRPAVVQFVKGRIPTGEERFLRRFADEVPFHVTGEGYTWETQDRARDVRTAQAGWSIARGLLADPAVDLLLLDELCIVLKMGYLEVGDVLADLKARPAHQHVAITGRGAPEALIEYADTVTEMRLVKHAFKAGVKAQPGIEF